MDYLIWSLICVVLAYIFLKLREKNQYFSKRGIPEPPGLPLIGPILSMFWPRRHVNHFVQYIYNTHKDAKYIGYYTFFTPTICIRDLDLVKAILVKNFDHFANRKTFVDEATDPLFGKNLNFLNGDRWREVRNTLSPAFTSSKMRAMYVLMSNCAENFTDQFLKKYGDAEAVEMKEAFGRYTTDVIASCAFGIEVDSLKDPNNEFYLRGKGTANFKGVTMLKILLELMFPTLTRKLGLRIVSKEMTDFFVDIIDTTMKAREERNIVRPDMLQLMMEARANMKEDAAARFDLLEMTAQAFLFFLAGFDATATQTSLMAHEMAVNPPIQRRVQAEIDVVMTATKGKPTYEAVNNSMPYLDAVFSETLRRHPIAFLNRRCSKEFELPPAVPGAEPFIVKPGAEIMIPVAGIHSDTNVYDDPERFDPERFINKKVTLTEVTNLGFGMGPRMCIGNRFAILETKALLVQLLARCSIVPCEKSCVPLEYCKNTFAPVAKGGFWFKLEPRVDVAQS